MEHDTDINTGIPSLLNTNHDAFGAMFASEFSLITGTLQPQENPSALTCRMKK
jgi:hypothetical protein